MSVLLSGDCCDADGGYDVGDFLMCVELRAGGARYRAFDDELSVGAELLRSLRLVLSGGIFQAASTGRLRLGFVFSIVPISCSGCRRFS